jgi:hypothetical protein
MGLMRSSFMRSTTFQSTAMFLPGSRWVLGSLLFIVDKFRDLSLHEPKSWEVPRSGTSRLPPAPVQVSLINEAQLRLGSNKLGKTDLDASGDKIDHCSHTIAACLHILEALTALLACMSCSPMMTPMMTLTSGAKGTCTPASGTCMPSCTGRPARLFFTLQARGP